MIGRLIVIGAVAIALLILGVYCLRRSIRLRNDRENVKTKNDYEKMGIQSKNSMIVGIVFLVADAILIGMTTLILFAIR